MVVLLFQVGWIEREDMESLAPLSKITAKKGKKREKEVLTHNQGKIRNKSKAFTKPTICREILKTFIRTTDLSRKFISAYFGKGGGNIN